MMKRLASVLAATAMAATLSACMATTGGAEGPQARFLDGSGRPIVSDYPHTVYGAGEAFEGVGLNAEAAKAVHGALDLALSSYNDETAYGSAVKVANCPGVGTGGYGTAWQGGGAAGNAYVCFTGSTNHREFVVEGGGKRVNAILVKDVMTKDGSASVWNIEPK